jgi:hypothetical protein
MAKKNPHDHSRKCGLTNLTNLDDVVSIALMRLNDNEKD